MIYTTVNYFISYNNGLDRGVQDKFQPILN